MGNGEIEDPGRNPIRHGFGDSRRCLRCRPSEQMHAVTEHTSFRSSDVCVTKTKITELKLEIYNSPPICDGLWFLYDRPIPAARYCRFVSNFDQMQIMTHREGATFQCVAKLWNTRKLLTARILEEHSEKCLLAAMLYNKYNVIR